LLDHAGHHYRRPRSQHRQGALSRNALRRHA
jgi:hypothetical protein